MYYKKFKIFLQHKSKRISIFKGSPFRVGDEVMQIGKEDEKIFVVVPYDVYSNNAELRNCINEFLKFVELVEEI